MSIMQRAAANAPSVVVIGGGATGLGIARDAALRGFAVTVVERGGLGSGTTGHFHGMLHSGGRYAVKDPSVAAECYRENQILRRIIPGAIMDTGGLFLALTQDEAVHADRVLQACKVAGIPTHEITASQAIKAEPNITLATTRAFQVPDGYIDGNKLLMLNRQAALTADVPATFLAHHRVTGFTMNAGKITGVTVQRTADGSIHYLPCDYVINASGVWAGHVTALASIPLQMVYDKGTMIVFKHSYSKAVLNRCRPENDGDLLVSNEHGSVMGTTARRIANPDACYPTQEEADLLIREGSAMIPRLSEAYATRIFAGVRPLLSPPLSSSYGQPGATRSISRAYRIIDHHDEGVDNFMSVIGGKVTIYRLMAEAAVDLLCRKAHITQKCTTAITPIEMPEPIRHVRPVRRTLRKRLVFQASR